MNIETNILHVGKQRTRKYPNFTSSEHSTLECLVQSVVQSGIQFSVRNVWDVRFRTQILSTTIYSGMNINTSEYRISKSIVRNQFCWPETQDCQISDLIPLYNPNSRMTITTPKYDIPEKNIIKKSWWFLLSKYWFIRLDYSIFLSSRLRFLGFFFLRTLDLCLLVGSTVHSSPSSFTISPQASLSLNFWTTADLLRSPPPFLLDWNLHLPLPPGKSLSVIFVRFWIPDPWFTVIAIN